MSETTELRSSGAVAAVVVVVLVAAGCSMKPADFNRQPALSPVGSGVHKAAPALALPVEPPQPARVAPGFSTWSDSGADLFRDARAMRVGDVITVKISIKDKASLDNSSSRSRDSSIGLGQSMSYGFKTDNNAATGSGNLDAQSKSNTESNGKGAVSRSETIELMVAAVVTDVLPNGHLVINGTQEVRVNFELRELTVAGVVRPRDVSTDNVVSYERIAEARISYGGRGRITEVQQPPWGQQLIDLVTPF
jgi:flagellar L-ring protein precursor FlgH